VELSSGVATRRDLLVPFRGPEVHGYFQSTIPRRSVPGHLLADFLRDPSGALAIGERRLKKRTSSFWPIFVLPQSVPDPIEPFNRIVYCLNSGIMTGAVTPTAKVHRHA
jgi:hypothetical protein